MITCRQCKGIIHGKHLREKAGIRRSHFDCKECAEVYYEKRAKRISSNKSYQKGHIEASLNWLEEVV